jgi:acyl-CoA synthetase (AMP-forming)/AMP-acid ligase II
MPVERPQAILVLASMYHVNAFATLHSMLAGDRLGMLEKFDARRAIDVIGKHRVTTFTATPTMLQRIADVPGVDDQDLSSLAWILQGAAPMAASAKATLGLVERRAPPANRKRTPFMMDFRSYHALRMRITEYRHHPVVRVA